MISFLVLSAYGDYVEGREQLQHNPQSHPESNRHPSTETISMVKMPSWECISPFPKTRCLELGSERQPHRGAAETNAPLELGLRKGTVTDRIQVSRHPPTQLINLE